MLKVYTNTLYPQWIITGIVLSILIGYGVVSEKRVQRQLAEVTSFRGVLGP